MDRPQTPDDELKKTNQWLIYSGMALEMFIIIALFAFAGNFLDKKLSSQPFLMIVFLMLGLAIAFYRVMKSIKKV